MASDPQHERRPDVFERLVAGTGAAIDELGGHFTLGYTAVVATAARTNG